MTGICAGILFAGLPLQCLIGGKRAWPRFRRPDFSADYLSLCETFDPATTSDGGSDAGGWMEITK